MAVHNTPHVGAGKGSFISLNPSDNQQYEFVDQAYLKTNITAQTFSFIIEDKVRGKLFLYQRKNENCPIHY